MARNKLKSYANEGFPLYFFPLSLFYFYLRALRDLRGSKKSLKLLRNDRSEPVFMKNLIHLIVIVILIIGISAVAEAQDLRQGTGSISGRVTVNGKPGRGVVVLVIYEGKDKNDDPHSFADLLGRINRLTCGEDGSFHLTNLDAGRYQIGAYTPSLIGVPKSAESGADPKIKPASEDEDEDEDEKQTKAPEPSSPTNRTINLQDGEKVENVEFTLTRGGVINGRVTYEDGSPAIGVIMQLNQIQGNSKNYYTPHTEFESSPYKTDDRGIYRIYGLPDGRYKISAGSRTGEAMQVLSANRYRRRTFHPNVTDEASAAIIEITNGSEAGNIDIRFAEPAKSYSVSGRVVAGDTNQPVPNAPVTFTPQNSQTQVPPEKSYTTTNSKGEFKLEGFPSGAYKALSPPRGYDADTPYVPDAPVKPNDYYSSITKFEVKDGDVRGVVIRLQPGITIGGSIVIESGDASPLSKTPGVKLYASIQNLTPAVESNFLSSNSVADVSPDGSFLLRGLSPGRVHFFLNSIGENTTRFQLLRVEASNVVDGQFMDLQKGDNLTNVRLIVAAANCTIKGQINIEGTLPKHAPILVSARKVNVAKKNANDEDDDDEAGETTADANGNFVITGLLAGQYEIVVEVVTGFTKDGDPITKEAKQIVVVTSGQEATVTLTVDLR